jgi:hypothetical protein
MHVALAWVVTMSATGKPVHVRVEVLSRRDHPSQVRYH